MYLLVAADPGSPGQRAVKQLCVYMHVQFVAVLACSSCLH